MTVKALKNSLVACVCTLAAVAMPAGRAFAAGETAKPAPSAEPALPEVYENVMDDPDFAAAMTALSRERGRVSRGPMARGMEKADKLVARARAALKEKGALPKGRAAQGKAIQAELDGNPDKYPEWLPLCKEMDALKAKDDEYKARIKELWSARRRQAAEDAKAVREGRAVFKKTDPAATDAMWAERWKKAGAKNDSKQAGKKPPAKSAKAK